MNKQKLAVANRISAQLDTIKNINDALSIINEANSENVAITFSIFCNSNETEVSVSSGELVGYDLSLSNILSYIVSDIREQVSSKYADLNDKFEGDKFDEE